MQTQVGTYWLRLYSGNRALGAAFLVTRRYAMTAAHCLQGLGSGSELDAIPVGDRPLRARVDQVSTDADIALVELLTPAPASLRPPATGRCRPADGWFAPHRPTNTDPHLRGTVVHDDVQYKCEGGAVIRALQLETSVTLGDYSGYSGGPVERLGDEDACTVVGMLLEQLPDRADPHRATNVLFAAAIGGALRLFDAFDVEHLLPAILDGRPAIGPSAGSRSAAGHSAGASGTAAAVARVESVLVALQNWAERGLLDPAEVRTLRVQVARSLLDE